MFPAHGRTRFLTICLMAVSAWLPVATAGGTDDFSLLRSIPADVAIASASRSHDGQKFLNEQYERVWAEFEKVGLHRDIKVFLKQTVQDDGGDVEAFEATWQKMSDMASLVDWSKLAGRESAFGMRFGFPIEMVAIFLPTDGKSKETFEGLSGIAKQLIEMSQGMFTLVTEDADGTTVHRISLPAAPIPFSIVLATHKDAILFGFGAGLVEQSLSLLTGKGGESIAGAARFKAAVKDLPAAKDSVHFTDATKLFSQINEMLAAVLGMAPSPAPDSPDYEEYKKVTGLPKKIMEMFDFTDFTASVSTTDGKKSTSTSITALKSDAKSKPFYAVMYGNEPLSDPLRFIPKEAGDFSVNSGIDLAKLYNLVIGFMKENVPDPDQALMALNEFKAMTGFDLEKDVLGTFEGGMINFTIPGPTPYAKSKQVYMLKVRDEAKARALLDHIVEEAKKSMTAEDGSIVDAELEGVTGFKTLQLQNPMISMIVDKPTFGVANGWLFIGLPGDAIQAAIDTAAGKSENISKNERVQSEGLPAEKGALALSYSDSTKWAESVGGMLGMAGMIPMFAPDVAKEPGAKFVLGFIPKIGRIIKSMDFYQSSASRTTMKGDTITTVKVLNFRESPSKKAGKPSGEGKAESGADKPATGGAKPE